MSPEIPAVEAVGEQFRYMGRKSFEAFKIFFDKQGYLIRDVKCTHQNRPVYPLRQNDEAVPIKILAQDDAELMGSEYIFVLQEKPKEE